MFSRCFESHFHLQDLEGSQNQSQMAFEFVFAVFSINMLANVENWYYVGNKYENIQKESQMAFECVSVVFQRVCLPFQKKSYCNTQLRITTSKKYVAKQTPGKPK